MKTIYWLLAVCIAALCVGVASIWYLHHDQMPSRSAGNSGQNGVSDLVDSKKMKSPVLGTEILGLPEYCSNKLISVSGCNGMTEITTDQGNTYRLVEIGDQCWFADNLKETPTTDQGWYGYYNGAMEEPLLGEGMLYTWEAAMNGKTAEREQGVCPTGWHVPSDCEYWTLENNFQINVGQPTERGSVEIELGLLTYLDEVEIYNDEAGLTLNFGQISAYRGLGQTLYSSSLEDEKKAIIRSMPSPRTSNVILRKLTNMNFANGKFSRDGFSIKCLRD